MRFSTIRAVAGVAGLAGASFYAGSALKENSLKTHEPVSLASEKSLLEASKEKLNMGMQLSAKEDPTRERTFIMVKPDGVQRGLVGEIIKRFEQKGFKLIAIRMMRPGEAHLRDHYYDLSGRSFFKGLIEYMNSGPVVAMCWEGQGAVLTGRVMLGETNPKDSKPGTIRGDYCIQVGRNIIHGSDAVESANHEINLWFNKEDICDYEPADRAWVYGDN